jgi:PERQ amino acid-rich with GYF domain-containing protein
MQKWYEEGYFTPSLLMKRVSLDIEWTSVGDLLQRAGNPRPFLTPLAPAVPTPPPPALPRRDPLLDGSVQDGSFTSPYQPVPTRSLRTSTVDPYVHNGSMVPDSPSSSFSVGRFSNGSPDPNAFGNRLGNMYNGSPVGSRLGFAGIQNGVLEPQRRSTFDTIVDPVFSRPGFQHYMQHPASTEGLGYNGRSGYEATTKQLCSLSQFRCFLPQHQLSLHDGQCITRQPDRQTG